jgi:hypothetical protein
MYYRSKSNYLDVQEIYVTCYVERTIDFPARLRGGDRIDALLLYIARTVLARTQISYGIADCVTPCIRALNIAVAS